MANKDQENVEETKVEETSESSIVEEVVEAAEKVVEATAETVADAVETVSETVETVAEAVSGSTDSDEPTEKRGKRSEKIGVVQSDKMEKTVTVRVDRLVKHPMYRKYVKKRKKFMAHDELGASTGDKVRIVETRPLSARKRWRVVEIVQKAVK
jgi:ribosomal protein uS17